MMNERFEKLMYESGLIAQGCWDSMDEYDREAIEKFAELIVRECAALLMQAAEELEDQSPNKGYFEIAADLSETVKNHFGVEE